MQQLHLVGFTTDHKGLILGTRRGTDEGSYVVTLDGAFVEQVEELLRLQAGEGASGDGSRDGAGNGAALLLRRPKIESKLTPREVQSLLRSGRSVGEVAEAAGMTEDWVGRFAPPVLAEQQRVIDRATGLSYSKPRIGPSIQPLGESAIWNLAERGIVLTGEAVVDAWSAFQLPDGGWVVRVSYLAERRRHHADWAVDMAQGSLKALNRLGNELGYVEPGRRRPTALPPAAPVSAAAQRAAATTPKPAIPPPLPPRPSGRLSLLGTGGAGADRLASATRAMAANRPLGSGARAGLSRSSPPAPPAPGKDRGAEDEASTEPAPPRERTERLVRPVRPLAAGESQSGPHVAAVQPAPSSPSSSLSPSPSLPSLPSLPSSTFSRTPSSSAPASPSSSAPTSPSSSSSADTDRGRPGGGADSAAARPRRERPLQAPSRIRRDQLADPTPSGPASADDDQPGRPDRLPRRDPTSPLASADRPLRRSPAGSGGAADRPRRPAPADPDGPATGDIGPLRRDPEGSVVDRPIRPDPTSRLASGDRPLRRGDPEGPGTGGDRPLRPLRRDPEGSVVDRPIRPDPTSRLASGDRPLRRREPTDLAAPTAPAAPEPSAHRFGPAHSPRERKVSTAERFGLDRASGQTPVVPQEWRSRQSPVAVAPRPESPEVEEAEPNNHVGSVPEGRLRADRPLRGRSMGADPEPTMASKMDLDWAPDNVDDPITAPVPAVELLDLVSQLDEIDDLNDLDSGSASGGDQVMIRAGQAGVAPDSRLGRGSGRARPTGDDRQGRSGRLKLRRRPQDSP